PQFSGKKPMYHSSALAAPHSHAPRDAARWGRRAAAIIACTAEFSSDGGRSVGDVGRSGIAIAGMADVAIAWLLPGSAARSAAAQAAYSSRTRPRRKGRSPKAITLGEKR